MEIFEKTLHYRTIVASEGMCLYNSVENSRTATRVDNNTGIVYAPAGADTSAWIEMSPEAADKLIAENEAKRQAEEEAAQEGTNV